MMESYDLESVITAASVIMRKCFPKCRIPVPSPYSPFNFPQPTALPVDDQKGQVCGVRAGERQSREAIDCVTTRRPGDDYDSSVENEDEDGASTVDTVDSGHKQDSDDDGENGLLDGMSYRRSWTDLSQYKQYFTELSQYDSILKEMDPTYRSSLEPPSHDQLHSTSNSLNSISVDQASSDRISDTSRKINLDDSGSKPDSTRGSSSSESIGKSLNIVSLRHNPSGEVRADEIRRGGYTSSSSITHRLGKASINSSGPSSNHSAPSAADISPKISKKKLHARSPKMRRKAAKSKQSKQGGKEKKVGAVVGVKGFRVSVHSKPSVDDWFSHDTDDITCTCNFSSCANGRIETNFSHNSETYSDDRDDKLAGHLFDGVLDGSQCGGRVDDPEMYADLAMKTRSVGRFVKLAYPNLHGHFVPPFGEPFYEKQFGTQRQKIFQDIDRFLHPEQMIDRVVFDLDELTSVIGPQPPCSPPPRRLTNQDERKVVSRSSSLNVLQFESRFECGNLRKAIQVREFEYDLVLNPDINTNTHHQWFYFEVSNMLSGVSYQFNIINCEKLNSQFNFGMRPVMYSVREAMYGRPYWFRTGAKICYYKNHFVRSAQTTGGQHGKTYCTTSFNVTFRHDNDVCYIAYHFPYTYTMLQYHISRWERSAKRQSDTVYFNTTQHCRTLSDNSVPLLTITAKPHSIHYQSLIQFKSRPYIFLSARVHPGECNSSWVMKGTIDFLLSDSSTARSLREMFIFKIVPMLNPDGVINGCHRSSLTGEDLNRQWFSPCPTRQPSIYHTKGLLQFLHAIGRSPLVFCDYHGHSRRKNVFLYGCSPSQSWITEDQDNPAILSNKAEDNGYKVLPKVLGSIAPAFSHSGCSFSVDRSKETTARVVVWRQMRVVRSYTMESSYCGCDQGPYKGYHMTTEHLEEMGQKFAEGLLKVRLTRGAQVSSYSSLASCYASGGPVGAESGRATGLTAEDGSGLGEPEHYDDDEAADSDLNEDERSFHREERCTSSVGSCPSDPEDDDDEDDDENDFSSGNDDLDNAI